MATKKVGSWTDDPERIVKNGEAEAAFEAAAAKPAKVVAGGAISLPKLDVRHINIRIIGDSELIVHRWSEKAIKMMLDKQMSIASAGKEPKDPERDYEESMYRLPDGGYGFPSIAFKCAAVEACTSLGKSVTKVAARQSFHVVGELVRIEGEPHRRQDMVRVGQGTADIRYRAGFFPWATTVTVRYNSRVLSDQQVLNLFNTAGFAVGVGEWRSEKNGSYGLFHVG